ncbi:Cell cycle protein [Cardinium endosymbiont of Sogatella furcifera]|uniref:FtsW/RodA/SpoVE family cell cycle protein n=1 Tax=Cardinium endosymbiont of Sogatella furcifera TaxID=650378 RepID=UPI000E0D3C67|nr:FtsW/RodA/SpoVE family cell cycle protein [Cardinium endosymbiont of Sogatella furcifera]AXI24274.1 Cell cycle protein [Cardinium endosymbiont of Sogatella furcifera]
MKQLIQAKLKGDPIIWGIALVLSNLSILTVYSASSSLAYRQMDHNTEYYLLRQTLLIGAGLAAMWLSHRIDYRYYAAMAKVALWLSIPLLLVTWQYGVKLNEASRWLHIPLINKSFQPSDLAQLSLIIRMAHMLAKQQKNIACFRTACLPMLAWSGLISGLIALTNFSSAMLLFGTCLVLMFIGRVPIKYLLMIICSGSLVAGGALLWGQRGGTAAKRIASFLKGDVSFQAEQSYIAIATGGLAGKGPGNSTQRNFLPHPYSDFIYAILIEEYGLIGGICVMVLYLLLLYRAIALLPTATHYYGGLLATGISLLLVLQALLNMAIAVGLGPVTGLPLPFVSMGGTSLVFTGIALGILLSISQGEIDKELLTLKKDVAGMRYNKYKKNPKS